MTVVPVQDVEIREHSLGQNNLGLRLCFDPVGRYEND